VKLFSQFWLGGTRLLSLHNQTDRQKQLHVGKINPGSKGLNASAEKKDRALAMASQNGQSVPGGEFAAVFGSLRFPKRRSNSR